MYNFKGIRMSPEQWSQKLFGDPNHKSEMQSIIDKLQSQQTLENLITDFYSKALLNTQNETDESQKEEPFQDDQITKNKLNQLFVQVKDDFEFISSIIFEKKNITPTKTQLRHLSDSSDSTPPRSILKDDSSNQVSDSDDDESAYNDHLEDDEDFDCISNSTESKTKAKIADQEQTKIVWSLLIECIKRTCQILASHIEYSAGMSLLMSSSMINNASLGGNTGPNNSFRNGYKNQYQNSIKFQINDSENDSFSTKHSSFMLNSDLMNKKNNSAILSSPALGHVSPGMTEQKYQHKNGYQVKQKYPANANNQINMNQQYMFNVSSQPFFPSSNNYNNNNNANNLYNVANLHLLNNNNNNNNPSLPQMGQFANEANSFFYDQNNNSNNGSFEACTQFHQTGVNFDRELQVSLFFVVFFIYKKDWKCLI